MDPELKLMLAQLDQTTKELWEELGDDLTEEELVWQPFPNGHSIAALLVHIAEVEAFWLHHIAGGQPYREIEAEALDGGEINQDAVLWPTAQRKPLAFYKELCATVRSQTKEQIAAIGDVEFVATRAWQNGTTKEFTLRWLLTHVIIHEAYHGGQAVLLLLQQRKAAQ